MADRKKALFWLRTELEDGDCLVELPYSIAESIYNMLKEQEPVKPTRDMFDRCYCGNCDEMLLSHAKFCHNCGKAVKWDEIQN